MIDFDALCAAAYPNGRQGPRAAVDALWTATLSLRDWHFAVVYNRPGLPFTKVLDGKRFLFVFTDGVRHLRFVEANANSDLSVDFVITEPVAKARARLVELAREGVFGVHFNFGQPGWFAALPAIEAIAAHLEIDAAPPSLSTIAVREAHVRAASKVTEWCLAVCEGAPMSPFRATVEGRTRVFVFTDRDRVSQLGQRLSEGVKPSREFWVALPLRAARAYLASLSSDGVVDVELHHGDAVWSIALTELAAMDAHDAKAASEAKAACDAKTWVATVARSREELFDERLSADASSGPSAFLLHGGEPRAPFVKGHLADFPRRPFEPLRVLTDEERERWEMLFLDRYTAQFLDEDEALVTLEKGSLYRTKEGAILDVDVTDHGRVSGYSIFEGDRARERDAYHAFQFENDLWNKLTRLLVVGAVAADVMEQAFGPKAKKVPLIEERKLADGSTERLHRAPLSGLVVLRIAANGTIQSVELLSGGDAFRRVIDAEGRARGS